MGTEEKQTQNLRGAYRNKVLKSARIVLGDKSMLDCTVRDMSETGAKILIANAVSLPDHFRLVMTMDGSTRSVSVIRRTAQQLGVKFLGPAEKPPAHK